MQRLLLLVVFASACASSNGVRDEPDAATDPTGDGSIDPDAVTNTCASAEVCDGVIDDNCDGEIDEGCGRCPLLTISCPTGCCPVDRWQIEQPQAAMAPSIAVDAAGNIFVAYSVYTGAWMAKLAIYNAPTGVWRIEPLGAGTYRNRVMLDATGRLHVLSAPNGGGLTYRRSDDKGLTFPVISSPGVLNGSDQFDMALDSTGAPHVVYNGKRTTSSFGDLRYTHLVGTTWMSETLDPTTTVDQFPTISIGFGNRPHIVADAYAPGGVAGTAKRYLFWNGNRWITENIDTIPNGVPAQYTSSGHFTKQSMHVYSDDSRDVLFTRKDAAVDQLMIAHRGPAETDTWVVAPIAGATAFADPTLLVDAHGKRTAVSDGLTLHREGSAGAWTSMPVGIPGTQVAYARRGRYLYVAFIAANSPTVTVIDLGP
jgi:hypothetical protein